MVPHELKQFLRSGLEAKVEARRHMRRVEALESLCTRVTASPQSLPGGGGVDRETLLASLADARTEAERAVQAELAQYRTVEGFIAGLPDPTSRIVLRLRCLEGRSWADVQRSLYEDGVYYSERHLRRLYQRALDEAQERWEVERR